MKHMNLLNTTFVLMYSDVGGVGGSAWIFFVLASQVFRKERGEGCFDAKKHKHTKKNPPESKQVRLDPQRSPLFGSISQATV